MNRQALRLVFVLGVLAFVWTGISTAGSGVMQCVSGPIPCANFDHGGCNYNLDANGCCVAGGSCPGYCCDDPLPPPPPPPTDMVCDGVTYPCSGFNRPGCTYSYDAATNCCVSGGARCNGYCCP
jgi:hypothetical protein